MDTIIQFASAHPILAVAAFLLTALTLANELRLRATGGTELTPQQAVLRINAGATVLDVRAQERFRAGHIVNARHVAADEIAAKAQQELAALREQPLLVVDDNGFGAAKIVRTLNALEFADVASIKGGITAWAAENLPLERGK